MEKIFISHSSADRNRVKQLENVIKKDGHFKAIIAADNREPLVPLTEKVKSGILECTYVIPVLTNESIATQWINQEIGYAFALNKDIRPIVEKQIISNLKGFIHNNVDLPHSFERDKTTRKTASNF